MFRKSIKTSQIQSVSENDLTEIQNCSDVYIVSWYARHGEYNIDRKRAAKVFLNEEDAVAFCQLLKKAKRILQDTDDIDIKVEKQK